MKDFLLSIVQGSLVALAINLALGTYWRPIGLMSTNTVEELRSVLEFQPLDPVLRILPQ